MTLGLAGSSFAKTEPAVACGVTKLKTVGGAASALLACHAKAAQKGLEVDAECLDAVDAKVADAFAKADRVAEKAGAVCPSGGQLAENQAEIDAFVAEVVAALRPQQGASKCAAKKLASVGKYAQKLLGAHALNRVKPDALKFADKTAKSEAVLAGIFAKLDEKAKDCLTSGDASPMSDAAERLIVTQVCDDANRCTLDAIAGLTCQHTAVTCAANYACDFHDGSCQVANCCLLSSGTGLCVVEIPFDQVPTSQAFCQNYDATHGGLILSGVGPQCIGWRAAGATTCP